MDAFASVALQNKDHEHCSNKLVKNKKCLKALHIVVSMFSLLVLIENTTMTNYSKQSRPM